MEKLLHDNEHIVCFFSCITAMVENKKGKAGKRINDSESSEKDVEESSYNNCGISFWIVFNSPEYDISSFAEHISRKFLTAEFDLISYKVVRSRGRLKIQAALEKGFEIENVAVTDGTDFSCKPSQLVITKFIDCESKKELLSGLHCNLCAIPICI